MMSTRHRLIRFEVTLVCGCDSVRIQSLHMRISPMTSIDIYKITERVDLQIERQIQHFS